MLGLTQNGGNRMKYIVCLIFSVALATPVLAGPQDVAACKEVNQWLYQKKITPTDMSYICNTSIRTKAEWYCVKDKIESEKDNLRMARNKCFK